MSQNAGQYLSPAVYMSQQLTELHRLLAKFTEKAGVKLEQTVNDKATRNGWPIRMMPNGQVEMEGLQAEQCRAIMSAACNVAVSVIGERPIAKNIQDIYKAQSRYYSTGIYECAFRLGLTEYLKK